MGYLDRFQKKDLSKNPELLPNLRSYALAKLRLKPTSG